MANTRRIELARKGGLYVFARIYFPHLLYKPGDNLIHRQLCTACDYNLRPRGRLLGLMPRGHAKSTYGTVALQVRAACMPELGKDHNLVIGATDEEVRNRMDSVIQELEHNEMLIEDYGEGIKPLQRPGGIKVSNKITDLQCHNGVRITGKAFMSNVRGRNVKGKRYKLVTMDDPENSKEVSSKAWRMAARKWIVEDLIPAMDAETGSLQWLGTLIHHDSVLQYFLDNRPTWDKLDPSFSQAATHWPMEKDDTVLWPEMYSRERLLEIEEDIQREAFMQEYMNVPYDQQTQVYKPEDWNWYDMDARTFWQNGHLYLRHNGLPDTQADRMIIYMSVDPAIGINKRHDFTGIVVGGVPVGSRDVYMLDIRRLKVLPKELVDAIGKFQQRWSPFETGIESVQYQAMLAMDVMEQNSFSVKMLKPIGNKEERIDAASVWVRNRRIHLPIDNLGSEQLVEEGKYFPGGTNKDLLDAYAQMMQMIDFGSDNFGVLGKRLRKSYTVLNVEEDYSTGTRRVGRM